MASLLILPVSTVSAPGNEKGKTPYPVRVSEDHRSLIDQQGKPFFYLGDTAWELFHRLDRDQAVVYLKDRAKKQFTVIQAVVLAEFAGLVEPNASGHLPLVANDPKRPVDAYFADVDFVVDRADALGLVVGMLPTWGDKWNKKWGQGPEIFTPENAEAYGEFLGKRYKNRPIIWILGGDRPVENDRQKAILRALAAGLTRGDEGRHLLTFHPSGGRSSADFFPDEPWLAFHMIQSGHNYNTPNYDRIAAEYARKPVKPCLDGEPGYEDHPAAFKASNGYLDAYDARKAAYWALLAGACGHTYGCHDIWQFLGPGRPPVTSARTPWIVAKDLPGAGQMRFARALMESRPILDRQPDQSLLASDPGRGTDHVQAARSKDGGYAFIYSASGKPFTVHLEKLSGEELKASWFDPRQGTTSAIGLIRRLGTQEFRPPSQGKGHDWVLILDAVSKDSIDPGKANP